MNWLFRVFHFGDAVAAHPLISLRSQYLLNIENNLPERVVICAVVQGPFAVFHFLKICELEDRVWSIPSDTHPQNVQEIVGKFHIGVRH